MGAGGSFVGRFVSWQVSSSGAWESCYGRGEGRVQCFGGMGRTLRAHLSIISKMPCSNPHPDYNRTGGRAQALPSVPGVAFMAVRTTLWEGRDCPSSLRLLKRIFFY